MGERENEKGNEKEKGKEEREGGTQTGNKQKRQNESHQRKKTIEIF